MSEKRRKVLWPALFIVLVASCALTFSFARTRVGASNEERQLTIPDAARPNHTVVTQTENRLARNLSLQPEAFKLSRRVGRRFSSARQEISVMTGTLTTGRDVRPAVITRRQNGRDERVEIAVGGEPASLTWSEIDGARSSGGMPKEIERALIERLAFDSVDQFVLGQLRGASYYTVARNARPEEAADSDSYNGPVWDVVRVDDPDQDPQRRPLSRWRLYYINSVTGLIDRVVCDLRGERIETSFGAWSDYAGEKVPSHITWARQGQVFMEFRLISFARNPW